MLRGDNAGAEQKVRKYLHIPRLQAAPWARAALHLVKEFEHQARQNISAVFNQDI